MAMKFDAKMKRQGRDKLGPLKKELIPRLMKGIDKATFMTEAEIKREVGRGGTDSAQHPTPNPGRHLRVVTGALRTSWHTRAAKHVGNNVIGKVVSSSRYARIHEFGGKAGKARIPQRAYVKPSLKRLRPKYPKTIVAPVIGPLKR